MFIQQDLPFVANDRMILEIITVSEKGNVDHGKDLTFRVL
jgi:hypothetical protein